MFRSMKMALEREGGTWVHYDPFYLKAVRQYERFKPTPGAVIAWECFPLTRTFCFEACYGFFHFLRARPVRDQNCIAHGHGDYVIQSNPNEFDVFVF